MSYLLETVNFWTAGAPIEYHLKLKDDMTLYPDTMFWTKLSDGDVQFLSSYLYRVCPLSKFAYGKIYDFGEQSLQFYIKLMVDDIQSKQIFIKEGGDILKPFESCYRMMEQGKLYSDYLETSF